MLTLEISVCLGQEGNLDVSDGEEEEDNDLIDDARNTSFQVCKRGV